MIFLDYLKARTLVGEFVAHEPLYFTGDFDWAFDTTTLWEALTCDWRGYVLVARAFDGVDEADPRPQVTWRWTHARDLRRVDWFKDVLGVGRNG